MMKWTWYVLNFSYEDVYDRWILMSGRYTDSCSIRNLDVQSDLDIKAVVQLGIML